eukprot:gene12329-25937_t
MSWITISNPLPRKVTLALSKYDDVIVVRRRGDITTISLVNSIAGTNKYLEFLLDGTNEEVDALLDPYFGSPMSPCVCPAAQVEVYNLLATFGQRQNVFDFPYIAAVFPTDGGARYRSKIAMHAVKIEIERLEKFGPNCPALSALPSGHTICDLRVTYAKTMLVFRIAKF